jgi:hypothetical protein
MKFKAVYSEEKDLENYLKGGWRFTYRAFGREPKKFLQRFPPEFQEALLAAKTEEEAKAVIKAYWQKIKAPNHEENAELIRKWVEIILNQESVAIIDLLEKLYTAKFPFSEITVFLTTFPLKPYNFEERWFMVGRDDNIARIILVAKHELNHFMFFYYYPQLKEKLGEEKFEILKEALVIFTNPEGNDKPAVKKLENYFKTLSGKPATEIINLALAREELFEAS